MLLEAEAANCFSSTYVLKLDGRPLGKFEGRWLSEGIDLALVERRRLRFEKVGWLGSHFRLVAEGEEEPVAEADRAGLFTSAWDLDLSKGQAQMVREGWFATGYAVQRGDHEVARVDRTGLCSRGWFVEGHRLHDEDLILIGLVYHTIRRREASRHAAAGGHAGS
ncbi:MAG TPA: hypothetical protein VFW33_18910 [Gemmataceae bacterium]|nr:hypothetical protein [Gemmataceae bacterium]